MKKITKEFNIYEFDELADEVKNKVLEREKQYQEMNYCDYQLYNDLKDKADELLKKYFNIKNGVNNINYDLSYCQGSGAMIEFDINIEDLNKKYNILTDEELRFINDKDIVNNIKIQHNNGMYYHEYTFNIEYYDNFGYYNYEDIKNEYNINENDFNNIENKIIDLLNDSDKH